VVFDVSAGKLYSTRDVIKAKHPNVTFQEDLQYGKWTGCKYNWDVV